MVNCAYGRSGEVRRGSALWPHKSLAKDAGIKETPPSATEFSIGHNVANREEVDSVMEQARKAGANIIKPAQDTF